MAQGMKISAAKGQGKKGKANPTQRKTMQAKAPQKGKRDIAPKKPQLVLEAQRKRVSARSLLCILCVRFLISGRI